MELLAENVESVFKDCLLDEGYTLDTKVIPVLTVVGKFGFNPDKIDKHSEDICSMISELNSNFDESNQGCTFMQLPFKGQDNQQWAEQRTAGLLLALGIASGWMAYTIEDPYMWQALPGGVPYVYRCSVRKDMSLRIKTVQEALDDDKKSQHRDDITCDKSDDCEENQKPDPAVIQFAKELRKTIEDFVAERGGSANIQLSRDGLDLLEVIQNKLDEAIK